MLSAFAIVLLMIGLYSCRTAKPKHSSKTEVSELKDSLLEDRDGNKYPIKKLLDNKLWMTTNLALTLPNSYCYDNLSQHCEKYGRLYTWETANEACKTLGEGWRLPTKHDGEQLTLLYGGTSADSTIMRKEAFKELLYTGTSGFNALLGGGRDLDSRYARLEAHGFYWTATEGDNNWAWSFNFAKGSQALFMQSGGEKPRAFSVRCVRDK